MSKRIGWRLYMKGNPGTSELCIGKVLKSSNTDDFLSGDPFLDSWTSSERLMKHISKELGLQNDMVNIWRIEDAARLYEPPEVIESCYQEKH